MFTKLAAAAALAVFATAAQADTGVPTSYSEGGGCFNFVMNGITYSVPNVGVGGSVTPRGGQASIDGWKAILLVAPRGTVTVVRLDGNREICPIGDYFFEGARSP